MIEPYHLLSPVFARFPWPFGRRVEVRNVGPLRALRMSRLWAGCELLPVHCYVVGDTLVDAGLACYAGDVVAFARSEGASHAVITHHHEDHVGAVAELAAHGIVAQGPEPARGLVEGGFPIRFYQHVLWGHAPPGRVVPFTADEVTLGPHVARIVPAPGHCEDQIALHVPSQGWLFSGDAFIDEHVKVFRRDEDFFATLGTLERFLALDFDALFCAHKPKPAGGKKAIGQKLAWLRDLEGQVRTLAARGLPPRAIARELPQPRRGAPLVAMTLGDVSVENMVRSILEGPRPRREVSAQGRSLEANAIGVQNGRG